MRLEGGGAVGTVHLVSPIAGDEQRLDDTAAYLVRNPLSLKKLVYLDGQHAVLYRSKMNPFLGRNLEALDRRDWLARMSDHLPDPGQHRTLFHGEYANRVRGQGRTSEAELGPAAATPSRNRCSPRGARMIAKVHEADPLVCTRCAKRMSILAFVTDAFAIRRILDHLGQSTPEAEKPPPLGGPATFARQRIKSPIVCRFERLAGHLPARYRKPSIITRLLSSRPCP